MGAFHSGKGLTLTDMTCNQLLQCLNKAPGRCASCRGGHLNLGFIHIIFSAICGQISAKSVHMYPRISVYAVTYEAKYMNLIYK